MLYISLSELLIVLLVGVLVLKPNDFIKIIHKLKMFYKDFKNNNKNEYDFLENKYFDYLNQDTNIKKPNEDEDKDEEKKR